MGYKRNQIKENILKNIFIIIMSLFLFMSLGWSDKIKVTEDTIIRSSVGAKDNVGTARAGEVFDVLEEIGAHLEIELTGGTEHKGKVGYVWIVHTKGNTIIGDVTVEGTPGTKLFTKPKGKGTLVCKVKAGATFKPLRLDTKWYKIGTGKYLYYYNTKKVK